ncbi:hypothetical protein J6590_035794 [Homalodisca vitripennis]|nr:hypothetical protein J6590_035794 [Homalodisca vitripennis]
MRQGGDGWERECRQLSSDLNLGDNMEAKISSKLLTTTSSHSIFPYLLLFALHKGSIKPEASR